MPEEARHQQEVAEEPDVLDVGRDPADEEQLDEQQGRAGQEQPERAPGERPDGGERLAGIG